MLVSRGCLDGQCSDKVSLMAWCLNETIIQKDRDFLRKCPTISIARDGRRQRLLVRFGGVTDPGI